MRTPAPVELALPPEADMESVLRALGRSMPVHAGATGAADRVLLDSFDGRLRARGWTAWRESRAANGAVTLVLDCPPDGQLTATARPRRAERILAGEVQPAPARSRLEAVLEERAMLPRVRVRVRSQALNVCNRDAKTVVRLLREDTVVLAGGSQRDLAPRLRILPVLGYDRDFARVRDVLTGRAGLKAVSETLADEACAAAGLNPRGVSSEVKVALDPAMPAGAAMVAVCRRLAEIVEANLAGTVDDLDPEFLHDLRVAVRRTRSVLKEMRAVLEPEAARRSRADLRWMQEITGPTRDLDVLLHDWPVMASPVPASMAADLKPLEEMLAGHRAAAFAEMRRQLRSRRFAAAWEAWGAVLHDDGALGGADSDRPVGELAGGRITAVYRAMLKMGSAIDDGSPPQALHDLRKRGKELRYLLELFGPMWPPGRVKPLVVALKGLQDVLGHFQDDEIQVAELRALGPELAAAPGGTDSLIALGFVLDGLSSSQRQARELFAARFSQFSGADTRRVIRRTFAGERRGHR